MADPYDNATYNGHSVKGPIFATTPEQKLNQTMNSYLAPSMQKSQMSTAEAIASDVRSRAGRDVLDHSTTHRNSGDD